MQQTENDRSIDERKQTSTKKRWLKKSKQKKKRVQNKRVIQCTGVEKMEKLRCDRRVTVFSLVG